MSSRSRAALLAVLMLAGCGRDPAADYTGTWRLDRPVLAGGSRREELRAERVQAADRVYVLRPDRSATVAPTDGSPGAEGSWALEEGGWLVVRAGYFRTAFLAFSPGQVVVPEVPEARLIRAVP
jgi:hypothetical protein